MQNDQVRWWSVDHDDQECIGKIQISIGRTITSGETNDIKNDRVRRWPLYQDDQECVRKIQRQG
ncbi:hypothetical protein Ddye_015135 [Dipteronia dyeriana]|uniref:Uncharacterized protein n=1 Tax=Dipteronia dyeriana TaxID=168575 RepID=A0AAD9U523_9ROSI|nr:hypothetical protein Ddye_015135 [Dipteronia dyeriana]